MALRNSETSYMFLYLKISLRVFHTRRAVDAVDGAVNGRRLRGAHLCSGVHRAHLVHSLVVVDGRGVTPELGGGVVQVQPLAEILHVGAAAGVHGGVADEAVHGGGRETQRRSGLSS